MAFDKIEEVLVEFLFIIKEIDRFIVRLLDLFLRQVVFFQKIEKNGGRKKEIIIESAAHIFKEIPFPFFKMPPVVFLEIRDEANKVIIDVWSSIGDLIKRFVMADIVFNV